MLCWVMSTQLLHADIAACLHSKLMLLFCCCCMAEEYRGTCRSVRNRASCSKSSHTIAGLLSSCAVAGSNQALCAATGCLEVPASIMPIQFQRKFSCCKFR